jgi:hypothetical protein
MWTVDNKVGNVRSASVELVLPLKTLTLTASPPPKKSKK